MRAGAIFLSFFVVLPTFFLRVRTFLLFAATTAENPLTSLELERFEISGLDMSEC